MQEDLGALFLLLNVGMGGARKVGMNVHHMPSKVSRTLLMVLAFVSFVSTTSASKEAFLRDAYFRRSGFTSSTPLRDAQSYSPFNSKVTSDFLESRELQDSANYQTDDEATLPPIMMIFIFMGFGLLWSFISSFFIYLSIKEDRLIQKYCSTGIQVKGDVTSCIYARGSLAQEGQQEYICIIEYDFVSSEDTLAHKVRVRKQVGAQVCDIYQNSTIRKIPTRILFRNSTRDGSSGHLPITMSNSLTSPGTTLYSNSKEESTLSKTHSADGCGGVVRPAAEVTDYVELLVLPDYPFSGYPKEQIQRKSQLSYRLSTLALPFFFLTLTALCLFGAAKDLNAAASDMERNVGKAIIMLFLTLYLLEFPVMYFSACDRFVSRHLEQEYLEASEHFIIQRSDGSTISSSNMRQLKNPHDSSDSWYPGEDDSVM